MFGKFIGSKKLEVKEVSREEFDQMRANRLAQNMPEQEEVQPMPLTPFKKSSNPDLISSGTGLIKGIEFGPDIVPVASSDGGVMQLPVATIYPAINSYIGNTMNFQEIHDYNNSQDTYFENSARVLLGSRVRFLLDNILEESRIYIAEILKDMRKEAKEIKEKMGKDCSDCFNNSCIGCPGDKYVSMNIFISPRDIIQLLPQLVDPDFYNTVKSTGGFDSNKELIQVTSMAFSGIILNHITINAIDEIGHAVAMEKANSVVQLAALKLVGMIDSICDDENIVNLFDHNPNFNWSPHLSPIKIADKL